MSRLFFGGGADRKIASTGSCFCTFFRATLTGMEWLLFALVGPLFWAISNFIDKYAIEKVTKGIADYAFFGGIGAILVITFVPLFFDITVPSLRVLAITALGGFLLNYTYMLYGFTLDRADTSRVIPIFQLRSPIVLIFGMLILGEYLTMQQTVAFGVMLTGAILLALDFELIHRPKFNLWSLFAFFATVSFAAVLLINNYSVDNLDIPSVLVYFDAGFLAASASFLLVPRWRRQIAEGLRTATWKKVALFTVNDLADEAGQLSSKLALATAPAAALVAVAQGIQSFYIIVGGLVLTLWFPHIIKEEIHSRALAQKFVGAAVIFAGVVLLNV